MQGSSSLSEDGFEVTLNIESGKAFFSLEKQEENDHIFNQRNLKEFLIKKDFDKLVFRNINSLHYQEGGIYTILLDPLTRNKVTCSTLGDAKKTLISLTSCTEKQAETKLKNLIGMKCKEKFSFTVGKLLSKNDDGNGDFIGYTGYSQDQCLLDLETFDISPYSQVRRKEGFNGEDLIPIMPRCSPILGEWDLICGFVDKKLRKFKKWFICSHQFYHFWQIIFRPTINIESIPEERKSDVLKSIIGQKSDKNFKIDKFNPKLFITGALDRKMHLRAKEQGIKVDEFKCSLLNRSEAHDRPIHTYVALALVAMFDIDYRKANEKVLDNERTGKGLKNWDLPTDFHSQMSSLIRKELNLPSPYPGSTLSIPESVSEKLIEKHIEREKIKDQILFSFFGFLQEKWVSRPSSRPKIMTPKNNGYNAFCWDFSSSINQKIDMAILIDNTDYYGLPSLSHLEIPMIYWQRVSQLEVPTY
jgi:hypothetical protein